MGRTHNKDYYTARGSSGGPAGPLDRFKQELAQEKALLRRDEEHRLPGERPLSGERATGAQARAGRERESVLDRLPKPVGAAGIPRSRRPAPVAGPAGSEERGAPHPAELGAGPSDFGVPASEDTALGGEREPFEREEGELRHVEREGELELPPLTRRMVRTFPQAFRVLGSAARAVDRPVKRTLHVLRQLGDEAAKPR